MSEEQISNQQDSNKNNITEANNQDQAIRSKQQQQNSLNYDTSQQNNSETNLQIMNQTKSLRLRKKAFKVIVDYDSDEENSHDEEKEEPEVFIFDPLIESIHCKREQNGTIEYFVKYQGRSFRHCEWMEEEELLDYDPSIKNKLKRFDRDYKYIQLDKNRLYYLNYDKSSLQIDRVITCSELFPVVHPKKGSQIKNKWYKNLLEVIQYLINFEQENIFYGIQFLNFSEKYSAYPEIQNNLDFSVINNRLYLDYYKSPGQFWQEILTVFDNYDFINKRKTNNDRAFVLYRIKQITKMCYQEWKIKHKSEFLELKEFFNSNYSEDDFNNFTQKFFEFFTLKVKDNFVTGLQNFIKEFAQFMPNIEQIKDLLDQIKEKGIKLQEIKKEFEQKNNLNQNGKKTEMIIEKENQSPKEIIEPTEMQQIKQTLKELITQVQMLINQNIEKFRNLFYKTKLKNLNLIYAPLQNLDFLIDYSPIDLSWINFETQKEITLQKQMPKKYFVKWKNLSYVQCTWENEYFVNEFSDKIKDFKTFNRALLKENRKNYIERYMKHLELREIYSNAKKYSRQTPGRIFELRKKVFGFKEMRDIFQYTPQNQPVYKGKRRLRSYQFESLNWMIESWTKRRNIILADEMGLGKTIQAMSFYNHLVYVENLPGPFMIIAPLGTLQHWQRVFSEWSYLNSILYYDSQGKNGRSVCRDLEWYRIDVTQKGTLTQHYKIAKFQVIITSFEVFLQDFEMVFQEIPFQHIIIDEAHRLKNKNAKIITMLKKLICNRIFLLTGTPIQNNISELWSLLNFIEPNNFDNLSWFKDEFEDLSNIEQLEKLKKILQPFLLRRMKEDVESSIPPLNETIIDIELTKIQKMVYKTVYEKSKGILQKGLGLKYVSMMNNLEMQLRKCCNHPFLLQSIHDNLLEGVETYQDYNNKMLSCSGKMVFLDKMIDKYKKENKKILIFSQFTEMLKLIEELLHFKQIHFEKIDGSTKAKERQTSIDRFNQNPDQFEVFLLSTKAGGIGINLTSARIVIIYDSDWNPQNDVQAIARAHRIGQTKKVKVFRLISKRTYESEMFERSSKKLGLDQAIFLSKDFTTTVKEKNSDNEDLNKLKPEEIEILLKKGMLGLLEDNDNQDEIMNMDIDEVIKNARVANYSFSKGSYQFSKGNFSTNKKEDKIRLDDPDFWKKVFVNSQTMGDKMLKKYEALEKSGKNKLLKVQKDFFLELNQEIYKYVMDRVKNEGFCEDTERSFNELLQKLQDSNDLHPAINDLIYQLFKDFKKKSRRIKVYNEKQLVSILKKNVKWSNKVERQKKNNKEPQQKEDDQAYNDEIDIYHDSDSDYFEQKKKNSKSKYIKGNFCVLCYQEKPDIVCSSFCQNSYHSNCLREQIKRIYPDIQCLLNSENKKDNNKISDQIQIQFESSCYFCHNNTSLCFECKKIGKIEENGQIKNLEECKSDNVYKCQICPKYYHVQCLVNGKIKIEKNTFKCSVHFCKHCQEFSDQLYSCVECTLSFHKKCLSKRNKILKTNVILCYQHKSSVKSSKSKKSDKKNSYKNLVAKKRNVTLKNNPPVKKKIKKSTKKSKKQKPILGFEYFQIPTVEGFDYKNYKLPWCRYCGARYSYRFHESDFGKKTICNKHYKLKRKQEIVVEKINGREPPLFPELNTELPYLRKKESRNKNKKQFTFYQFDFKNFLIHFDIDLNTI